MNFEFDHNATIPVLMLKGRLIGEFQTIELLGEVESQIADGSTDLVVDLSQLEYMNSSGLGFLLKLLTQYRIAGGEAVLCAVNNELEKLLVMTKINVLFTVANTRDDALASFTTINTSS